MKLTQKDFDILYVSPVGTIKETEAEITVRVPITKRQDALDFVNQVIEKTTVQGVGQS